MKFNLNLNKNIFIKNLNTLNLKENLKVVYHEI